MIFRFPCALLGAALLFAACGDNPQTDGNVELTPPGQAPTDMVGTLTNDAADPYDGPLKVSLAQWSLHKRYLPEGMYGGTGQGDPYDFAKDAAAMGFDGIEYVSVMYSDDFAERGEERGESILEVMADLHERAEAAGVEEVLIMVDGEGELAETNEAERVIAVENHKRWVDAAAASGIPTIRVNAGGESLRAKANAKEAHDAAVRSLSVLGAYAAPKNVNVVVENHGGYSSDPVWLRDVMAEVDMGNVGVLPDFGNFCRRRVNPTRWEDGCADEVPADSIYAAVGMWMPYAHAVSAKSFDFDAEGNETKIDFARMLDTVRSYGYDGYVGVEYEGGRLGEPEGIEATKALLKRN